MIDTAKRKAIWIHERWRSLREKEFNCACCPFQKIPRVMKLMHVADKLGRRAGEGVPQLALAMDHFARRHVEIQNQQRHGDGEDAVAESRKPLQTLPCNLVIRSGHVADIV